MPRTFLVFFYLFIFLNFLNPGCNNKKKLYIWYTRMPTTTKKKTSTKTAKKPSTKTAKKPSAKTAKKPSSKTAIKRTQILAQAQGQAMTGGRGLLGILRPPGTRFLPPGPKSSGNPYGHVGIRRNNVVSDQVASYQAYRNKGGPEGPTNFCLQPEKAWADLEKRSPLSRVKRFFKLSRKP